MAEVKYKKIRISDAIMAIAACLEAYLKKGKVLLSLSGGSAIDAQLMILKQSKGHPGLLITLNDERYGPRGHADSNWQKLMTAGLGDLKIRSYEVLRDENPELTTNAFNQFLLENLQSNVSLVSILGMGADGHTSGILAGSPAVTSNDLATYYEASDYNRVTNTPKFLAQQTEIWVLAYGEAKREQLKLLEQSIDISAQPVQIIKSVALATVYNDYKGEIL